MKRLRIAACFAFALLLPSASEAAFIDFSTTTTNFVATEVDYAFLFGVPVPGDLYTFASAMATVTVTPPLQGTATVEISGIYPYYLSGYGMVGATPTNLLVDAGATSCVASGGLPTTCSFGPVLANFAPTLYDAMEALLTFKVTGLGATAIWNGRVTLATEAPPTSTPEPALATLLGVAVFGAGLRARRRRS